MLLANQSVKEKECFNSEFTVGKFGNFFFINKAYIIFKYLCIP